MFTGMGRVDPEDDTITRYVVFHYRYDPDRHERRNMIEAAFDDADEMVAYLNREGAALKARQDAGSADLSENHSGTVFEPGATQRTRQDRLERQIFLRTHGPRTESGRRRKGNG